MKVFIENHGCASNVANFEIICGLLKKSGFEIVDSPHISDIIILNTCVVKAPTENKMKHKIHEYTKLKKHLIVVGCMPKSDPKAIKKINPKASMISGENVEKIVEVVSATIEGKRLVVTEDLKKPKCGLLRCRKNPMVHIAQIGIGCLSNCAFCSEPYKGKLFSYPTPLILMGIESAIKDGCKEIWISSLDNSCYGFDIKTDLSELLEKICSINGNFFVRVGMMNPLHVKKFLDKLIHVYRNEKIFKFLHLPLQSGSDKILEKMRREYTCEEFAKIVEDFREKIPEITIATDIIVGFPGEETEDFELTMKFLRRINPDVVNISKFWHRTKARENFKISPEIVNERSSQLTTLTKKISLEKNRKWVGWSGKCLIDEIGKNGSYVGRNFAYKPIVIKTEENIFGEFVDVEITGAETTYLIGKLC